MNDIQDVGGSIPPGSILSSHRSARTHLVIFLLAVFVPSYALEIVMLARGGLGAFGMQGVFALMWIPGVAALGLKLALRRRLDGLGWRPPRARWFLIAFALPPAVALVAYGAAWSTGLAPLEVPWDRLAAKLAPGARGLVLLVALTATMNVAVGACFALGEEIGWRGVLVPLLVRAEVPYPLATSGLIWGLWHLPLILWGDYVTSDLPVLSSALFLATTTASGVIYGWARLASASVWPAVLLHASHNAFFQDLFDKLTAKSAASQYVVGESGLLPAAVYSLFALWIVRSGRARRAAAEAF